MFQQKEKSFTLGLGISANKDKSYFGCYVPADSCSNNWNLGKDGFFFAFNEVPKIISPIYEITVKAIGVIIPVLLAWGVIEAIGSLTARKDEQSILMAFDEKELRNGCPILMYKSKDKIRGYITRVWHSPIPLDIWIERQDRVEHQMKETIIKELDYDERAKDNRIVMISIKGMKRVKEEKPFFDNELEKDMENY